MNTIIFKYTINDDAAVLRRAKKLGYKEMVVDETLFVDGKIPIVHLTDADGELRYEMDIEWDDDTIEIISQTPKLDDVGEKIPVMGQKDCRIPNSQTAVEYISGKGTTLLGDWLAVDVEEDIIRAAKAEAKTILKTAEATAKATKEAVAASIEVTIE